jgi:hypothetical protein
MTVTVTQPIGAHLVGSIPLQDAEAVFRAATGALGGHLERVPDGETGDRSTWIAWQAQHLLAHPQFEVEPPPPGQYAPLPRFRLRDGVEASEVTFPRGIGYATAAIESYEVFSRLKAEGVIPEHVRFQVSLPTPLAPVTQFIAPGHQAIVEVPYERQLLRELEQIAARVPSGELAVQWDVAIEMGMWEGLGGLFATWFEPVREGIVDRLVRCAEATPDDVEMGFHLCYGDFGHEHFAEPADAANLAALSNQLTERISRRIDWIHLPVPRGRSDDAYFAPLANLRLHPDTKLYLGLVHMTDGREGAERRIAAARTAVGAFGVATECGFGRRPPESVRPLLDLHADVAAPVVSDDGAH